jgi:hypothetical protein
MSQPAKAIANGRRRKIRLAPDMIASTALDQGRTRGPGASDNGGVRCAPPMLNLVRLGEHEVSRERRSISVSTDHPSG